MLSAIRLAIRQFQQHPSFALITVLVLGLGTGAATTVFTVVLRPLPYGVNLVDPAVDPTRVNTIEVSGNLFEVLGVRRGPAYGLTLGLNR